MRSIPNLLLLLFAVCSAAACRCNRPLRTNFLEKHNDWNKPCLDECVFALTDHPNLGKGFVQIEGKGALVDLTQTFGWKVSQCSVKEDLGPRGEEHKKNFTIDLYLSCSTAKCRGVVLDKFIGRIARLSRSCKVTIGFAVVMQVKTLARAGETPHFIVSLTSNLAQTKQPAKFTLTGETRGNAESARQLQRRWNPFRAIGELGSTIVNAINPIPLIKNILNPVVTVEKDLPFNYARKIPLITGGSPCGSGANMTSMAELSVTPDVNIHARIGIYVSGSLGLAPSINEARAYAILNGYAGASLDLAIDTEGEFDTGEISIMTVPISPLTVGIASLGPSFELLVRTNGDMAGSGNLGYGLQYVFDDYEISLPDRSNSIKPRVIETGPSGSAVITGSLTTHIIPRFKIGAYAMALFDFSIFLDADVSMSGRFEAAFADGKGEVTEDMVAEEVSGQESEEDEGLDDVSKGMKGVHGGEEATQHSSERHRRKPASTSRRLKSRANTPFYSSFGSAQRYGHRHHRRGRRLSSFRAKKSKSSRIPDTNKGGDALTKGRPVGGSEHPSPSPGGAASNPTAAKSSANKDVHHATDEALSVPGEDQASTSEDLSATNTDDPPPLGEGSEPTNDAPTPTDQGSTSEDSGVPSEETLMPTDQGSTSEDSRVPNEETLTPTDKFSTPEASEVPDVSDGLEETEGGRGGGTESGLLAGATNNSATTQFSAECKLNLRGEMDLRVGAQATGGLLSSTVLSLLKIDANQVATRSLVKLHLFEANILIGNPSPVGPASAAVSPPAPHSTSSPPAPHSTSSPSAPHNTSSSRSPPRAHRKPIPTKHKRDIQPRRAKAMGLLQPAQALWALSSLPIDVSLLGMRCRKHPEGEHRRVQKSSGMHKKKARSWLSAQ